MLVEETKVIDVPARQEQKTTATITCDGCGVKASRFYKGETDWELNGEHQMRETAIQSTLGYNYPEGGDWTTKFYNVCPECMEKTVFPALAVLFGHPPCEKGGGH